MAFSRTTDKGWPDHKNGLRMANAYNNLRTQFDPYFANVIWLLHMNGLNNASAFPDSSSYGRTITPSGNPITSTAQSKFNGSSGYFNGSSYFDTADNIELAGAFTIECFLYPVGTGGMIAAGYSSPNVQIFRLNESGAGNLSCYFGGSFMLSGVMTTNQWQHVCVCRTVGGTVYMGREGVVTGFGTNSSAVRVNRIGMSLSSYFTGYMAEFRITNGVARYISNYTVPTDPFPNQ